MLKVAIHEIETTEQGRRILEQLIRNPDTSEHLKQVKVTKCEMTDINDPNTFSTRCKICNVTCHYPCDIHEDNPMRNTSFYCLAMTWFNTQLMTLCTVCPGQCPWNYHYQVKKREIFKSYEETRTIESIKQLYIRIRRKNFSH